MKIDPRSLLSCAALLAAGALLGSAIAQPSRPTQADERGEGRRTAMEVVFTTKTNEALAFVFDEDSKRLLMYTTVGGRELQLAAVRNTIYDARIVEYQNVNAPGMSVRDLKKTFDEEDAQAKKKAEEEAKKKEKEKQPKPG